MQFVKMTAQGNDYIYIDERHLESVTEEAERVMLAKRLSSRHFGIGGDGVVWLHNSSVADAKMLMYNADGSRGKMCGSALRCVVYLLSKSCVKQEYTVETDAGIRSGKIIDNGQIKVNMGTVNKIEQLTENEYLVDVGNLHIVRIVDNLKAIDMKEEIRKGRIDLHSEFNYEYAEENEQGLVIKIYERGSGLTLACGTGASASAMVYNKRKRDAAEKLKIEMPGGEVWASVIDNEIFLEGEVEEIFMGNYPGYKYEI